MSVQDDIQFYYRRAAEARARGKEALAQTMENYARNLEAGIYNDDGRGFDMGASNQRWAQKEAEEAARRKAAEEQLYASRPRRSGGGGGGSRRQSAPFAPRYSASSNYGEPPMDYPQGDYSYRDYRGDYVNDKGHSGMLAYAESGMSPRDYAQARGMSDDVDRNQYGHAKGSFLDFMDDRLERGKRYDW